MNTVHLFVTGTRCSSLCTWEKQECKLFKFGESHHSFLYNLFSVLIGTIIINIIYIFSVVKKHYILYLSIMIHLAYYSINLFPLICYHYITMTVFFIGLTTFRTTKLKYRRFKSLHTLSQKIKYSQINISKSFFKHKS